MITADRKRVPISVSVVCRMLPPIQTQRIQHPQDFFAEEVLTIQPNSQQEMQKK